MYVYTYIWTIYLAFIFLFTIFSIFLDNLQNISHYESKLYPFMIHSDSGYNTFLWIYSFTYDFVFLFIKESKCVSSLLELWPFSLLWKEEYNETGSMPITNLGFRIDWVQEFASCCPTLIPWKHVQAQALLTKKGDIWSKQVFSYALEPRQYLTRSVSLPCTCTYIYTYTYICTYMKRLFTMFLIYSFILHSIHNFPSLISISFH